MKTMVRMLAVAAVAVLAGCMDFGNIADAVDSARAVARIGVVAHPEVYWPNGGARLEKALSFYRSKNVDAIVVLGDLTRDGNLNQYRVLAKAWNNVFSNPAKGIVANPPRRFFILGEHDRERFRSEFADELEGDLSVDGGVFEVNGFKFIAGTTCAECCTLPTFYADGKPALTDELCRYPASSMAVNAGSLSGVAVPAGCETMAKTSAVSQGLLATVYSDGMSVTRWDFGDMEAVGPDWRIRFVCGAAGQDAEDRAPEFWEDTALRVINGFARDGTRIHKIEWPPVLAKHTGVRAGSYEVEAEASLDGGASYSSVKRFRVLSKNFCRSEDRESEPISCIIKASDLPQGALVRFSVTPLSSFGSRGRSLVGPTVAN